MKNFVQPGDTVTATAPTGGVASGDGVLIGALFGVASSAAAQGAAVELAVVGVFDLPKVTGQAFAAGDPVFWDATEKETTPDPDDNVLIGCALAAAGSSATTCRVRLNGIFGAASQAAWDGHATVLDDHETRIAALELEE